MNAEVNFFLPVLFLRWLFTLSTLSFIRAAHRFTSLTDTHSPERMFGYSLYILLFIIATLFLLPEAYW